MSTFPLRRGVFNTVRTTAIDRTVEFRSLVEDIYRNQGGQTAPDVTAESTYAHVPVQDSITYLSGLLENVSDHLRQFSMAQRQSGVHNMNMNRLEDLAQGLSRKLTDANLGCDTLEAAVEASRGTMLPHIFEHYRIMTNQLRSRLMETSKEFGRLLNTHQKSVVKQNERAKRFAYTNVEDMEGGVQEGDVAPASGELKTAFHRSRMEGMTRIQSTIYEVSQLFTRVSSMVAQQNEFVESIYADVESASWNLRAGEGQLRKYLANLSGSKWLIIKVFAIFIGFVVFFITFIM